MNYALSVDYAAFHEENNRTCGVLIIFLSNLGKQNNESLGTEKKGGITRTEWRASHTPTERRNILKGCNENFISASDATLIQ